MSQTSGDNEREPNDERGPGIWIAGLVLVGVGVVFLLQNMGYAVPANWWSLFILIPAFFAFAGAWRSYRRNDQQIDASTAGSLLTGIVLVALTVLFMTGFQFDWDIVWPMLLIVLGAIFLGRAYLKR
ncbi:LiaF transmembrane domain-containing protein [Bauldia sp.]|uniref:LiaF transmembrane domain-containing protein n=1 Tax=Bauldia sp. TaxID=2575872 RepID=UPI003BABA724